MQDLTAYILVTFVTCATPGAGVLFTVSSGLKSTLRQAWRAPLGNALGCLMMSILTATGIGGIITASDVLYDGLRLAGAAVLVWLGIKSWRSGRMDIVGAAQACARSEQSEHVLRDALLLQTSNPMLFVFLLSLLPQFLTADDPQYALHISILIALFIVICFSVHLAYSCTAVLARRFLSGPNFSFWLNRVSATLFWLLAAGVVRSLF